MNTLLKLRLESLMTEIENLQYSLKTGDKDGIKQSVEYAIIDLNVIANISRNLSDEDIKK